MSTILINSAKTSDSVVFVHDRQMSFAWVEWNDVRFPMRREAVQPLECRWLRTCLSVSELDGAPVR